MTQHRKGSDIFHSTLYINPWPNVRRVWLPFGCNRLSLMLYRHCIGAEQVTGRNPNGHSNG